MEYLTSCLASLSSEKKLSLHPKCKRTNTISLLFTDDLLTFRRGNVDSMKHIKIQLEKFSVASGLVANGDKSVVYMVGVQLNI